ncbi:hypothetical protein [Streptomyces sp. T12]|uniref:hypothetical protein n=1 Tax=Streptomyces sp. T12 TaxID=477697 RepID=UPI0021BDC12A|nr:hypothetical protein [Streptomyces sp. T12]
MTSQLIIQPVQAHVVVGVDGDQRPLGFVRTEIWQRPAQCAMTRARTTAGRCGRLMMNRGGGWCCAARAAAVPASPLLKAAALVHTLGRCRWLERSNMAVAAASGVMYLEAAGISVKPGREDAIALKDLLLDPACTAGKIAALLRTWPTTT